ncbi:MAG: SH3 domain-containing protein [Bacillota bacterium]|nr:SH3 domain-containing protein [Bacillota bacterium]
MDPDLKMPQLEVTPNKINIMRIQPGQSRDIEVKIANAGRGHITGSVELSPAIPGVSVSPETININEKFNKSVSVNLKINTTDSLKGTTALRVNTNAGEVNVPVSYRCVLPVVLFYPWLGAIGGFLAYYFLYPRFWRECAPYIVNTFRFPGFYAIFLAMAITIPAALIINSRKKTHRLLIPNLISALIATVLLANGMLPNIGTGFLFYAIMLVALWFVLAGAPMNGLPFTAVLGAYGANWFIFNGLLPTGLYQFSEKVVHFNEFWVPAAIFAFTGYGFGQWLLDRVNLTYIQKPARTLHYTGVVLMTIFIIAAVYYSYTQSLSGNTLASTGLAVTARQAAVYAGPSTGSNQIRTLPAGSNIKIIKNEGQWLKVEFYTNGFIHKSQVRVEGSNAVIISDSGSNLRSGPSLQQNNVITVVPRDKVVNVVSKEGDWYNVNYPETGYISQDQVK